MHLSHTGACNYCLEYKNEFATTTPESRLQNVHSYKVKVIQVKTLNSKARCAPVPKPLRQAVPAKHMPLPSLATSNTRSLVCTKEVFSHSLLSRPCVARVAVVGVLQWFPHLWPR